MCEVLKLPEKWHTHSAFFSVCFGFFHCSTSLHYIANLCMECFRYYIWNKKFIWIVFIIQFPTPAFWTFVFMHHILIMLWPRGGFFQAPVLSLWPPKLCPLCLPSHSACPLFEFSRSGFIQTSPIHFMLIALSCRGYFFPRHFTRVAGIITPSLGREGVLPTSHR